MRTPRIIAIILFLYKSLICSYTYGQYHNSYFEHLTLKDGLSGSRINAIAKDAYGYMWFATGNGLCKYNAYEFTSYFHNDSDTSSLTSNYVNDIFVDDKGSLWIATTNGLSRFNYETESFANYLVGTIVKNISKTSNGNLLLSFYDGISYFSIQTKQQTFFNKVPGRYSFKENIVNCAIEDKNGNLWIGTEGGLIKYNSGTKEFKNYNTFTNNVILGLFEDSKGNIWAGTLKGVNMIDGINGKVHKFNSDTFPFNTERIYEITEDKYKHLWFAGFNGVHRFNPTEHSTTSYYPEKNDASSLNSLKVRSVFADGKLIWLGTFDMGLSLLDLRTRHFKHFKVPTENREDFSGNAINDIFEDSKGNIWTCTNGEGLYEYNPMTKELINHNNILNIDNEFINYISTIIEQKNGNFLIGTGGCGLVEYVPDKKIFRQFEFNGQQFRDMTKIRIADLLIDSKNRLWIGSYKGLFCYDLTEKKMTTYLHDSKSPNSLINDDIAVIYESPFKNIWIGSWQSGLSIFEPKTNTFSNYSYNKNNPSGLRGQNINAITSDSKGNIWIASNNGFSRFIPKDQTFESYGAKDGLPGNHTFGIVEDDNGFLWISTQRGISKFDFHTKKFVNYDYHDGLQGSDFNFGAYCKGNDGSIYFGGLDGYTVFNPDSIEENKEIPQVVLTDLLLFNKKVQINNSIKLQQNKTGITEKEVSGKTTYFINQTIGTLNELVLEYSHLIFGFEFSALNYRQPKKNKYKYKLEGFDKNWIEASVQHRRALYTNVPHGKYTFRVIAANDDGVWNSEGVSIKLIILPPWWKTIWAKTIWILLSIGMLFSVYKFRVSMLEKQKHMLEKQVANRTAEIVTQNNKLEHQKEEIKSQAKELLSANEKLLELNEFKQGMTGMIVHDLKTPLNAIINTSEARPLIALKRIKQSGRQMLNMVLNILDVYKYEDSKLEIEAAEVSLFEISQNAISEVFFLAEQKNIAIKNNIKQALGVLADSEILERVFINLLTNAIKYSPNNSLVELTAIQESKKCKVAVSDNGLGISEELIPKVFDKFAQADAKKSGKVRSTGLGLTFCKMAIEVHGGEIGVNSIVGAGTTIWFTIKSTEEFELKNIPKKKEETENNKLILSLDDIILLRPYAQELNQLMVYETTKVEKIIIKIDTEKSQALKMWKEELNKSLFAMNEEKYKELINLAL